MKGASGQRQPWESKVLSRLSASGPSGKRTASYIAAKKVKLSFAAQPTGARWTPRGMLLGPNGNPDQPKTGSRHQGGRGCLVSFIGRPRGQADEQGLLTALSVYGELEAWQLQARVLRDLGAPSTNKAMLAIEKLKLSHDPMVLREAARLMKLFDPKYRIDLLPLNPLGSGIKLR